MAGGERGGVSAPGETWETALKNGGRLGVIGPTAFTLFALGHFFNLSSALSMMFFPFLLTCGPRRLCLVPLMHPSHGLCIVQSEKTAETRAI